MRTILAYFLIAVPVPLFIISMLIQMDKKDRLDALLDMLIITAVLGSIVIGAILLQ